MPIFPGQRICCIPTTPTPLLAAILLAPPLPARKLNLEIRGECGREGDTARERVRLRVCRESGQRDKLEGVALSCQISALDRQLRVVVDGMEHSTVKFPAFEFTVVVWTVDSMITWLPHLPPII